MNTRISNLPSGSLTGSDYIPFDGPNGTKKFSGQLIEDKADRADVLPLINIWDEQYENGTYNLTTGEPESNNQYIRTVNPIPVKSNTNYYISATSGLYVFKYGANGNYLGYLNRVSGVVNTGADTYFIRFVDVDHSSYSSPISINYPSTYNGYYPSRLAKVESRVTNRNLLDNPWFTVNQRGDSTYTDPRGAYTVDRWKTSAWFHNIVVDNNGITIQHTYDELDPTSLLQYLESLEVNRQYTLSIKLQDGSFYSNSGVINSTSDTIVVNFDNANVRRVRLIYVDSHWSIKVSVGGVQNLSIRAVKLELGTVSTLHMDTAPNYAEELLKCRRYARSLIGIRGDVVINSGSFRYNESFELGFRTRASTSNLEIQVYSNGWQLVNSPVAVPSTVNSIEFGGSINLSNGCYAFEITSGFASADL